MSFGNIAKCKVIYFVISSSKVSHYANHLAMQQSFT
jgi:hypothetical protein